MGGEKSKGHKSEEKIPPNRRSADKNRRKKEKSKRSKDFQRFPKMEGKNGKIRKIKDKTHTNTVQTVQNPHKTPKTHKMPKSPQRGILGQNGTKSSQNGQQIMAQIKMEGENKIQGGGVFWALSENKSHKSGQQNVAHIKIIIQNISCTSNRRATKYHHNRSIIAQNGAQSKGQQATE